MSPTDWLKTFTATEASCQVVRVQRFHAGPGWRIKPRTIPDHIIYVVLSGSIEVVLDGQQKIWQAGKRLG